MLTRRIIPCLDVTGGRVVKGIRFQEPRDAGDPAELAAIYDREGADELVFYDITASSDNRDIMLDVVARTASQVFIPLTVGGGLRTVEDMRRMLNAGADKVSINTAAVLHPDLINEGAARFGSQCIVLSMDVKRAYMPDGRLWWEVYIHGGRTPTGKDGVRWAIEGVERGAGELVLNSIDADGTQEGYDLELLREVSSRVPVPVIASGGAGRLEHFAEALEAGAHAVLAASLFHYGTLRIRQVKEYLAARGFPVRTTW